MTVAIVSAPPVPTASADAPSTAAADAATDGGVFASLLLGQLLPPPAQPPVEPKVIEPKVDESAAAPEDAGTDPAAILATLVTPVETGNTIDKTSKAGAETPPTLPTLDGAGRSGGQAATAVTDPASRHAPVTTAAADKPAKFAVADPSLATENVATTIKASSSEDSGARLSSLAATHAFGQTNHATSGREAELAVRTPLRETGWSNDFAQKVVWLANQDKQSAQLTLNPPQMGPIEISLTVDKGHATAAFTSPNADVREAIETALPRLREMFASAGIQLGQTSVGAESFQQQTSNDGGYSGASRWMSDNAILAADSAGTASGRGLATQRGNGMVDIFA